jgi:hypothetical protein
MHAPSPLRGLDTRRRILRRVLWRALGEAHAEAYLR